MHDPEKMIWPNVLASTKCGPVGDSGDEARFFAEAVTNDNECVVRTSVYWYTPQDGSSPVLMIEIDDEPEDELSNDITIRVRRNDGLVYEGDRADQENVEPRRPEDVNVRNMSSIQANALDIPTLNEWLKDDLPHATYVVDGDEAMGRRLSEESYHEHVENIHEARKVLNEMGLSRPQLDRLATMILKEES